MMPPRFSSLTRIAPLDGAPFEVQPIGRDDWASGDYVACDVVDVGGLRSLELADGRMSELARGDILIGVLGRRHATLEATGTFEAAEAEGPLHLLTSAGLVGVETSRAAAIPRLCTLRYRGHVLDGDQKATMRRYVLTVPARPFQTSTVLLVGTSMSAGKTTAGKLAVRQLARSGQRVVGAKLTGAGRYRDVLAYADAGAAAIFDFVDVGLPSSIVPEAEYAEVLPGLLARLAGVGADVAVVEIGASPLEPYNGALAIEAIAPHVVTTILAASDPYAVVGVMNAFDIQPDLVCGRAANTLAGIELSQRLSGVPAVDLTAPGAGEVLGRFLLDRLEAPPLAS